MLWQLRRQGQNTRRTKAQARRTVDGQTGATELTEAERLAAWEQQTVQRETQDLSAVHERVAERAAGRAGRAAAVLDDAAKRKAARMAVAEVQRLHAAWTMAQLRFEVHRALGVLPQAPTARRWSARWPAWRRRPGWDRRGAEDGAGCGGRDNNQLGVRASDGGGMYRPPNQER